MTIPHPTDAVFAKAYGEAWTSDPVRLLDFFTPDGTYTDVAMNTTYTGRGEIGRFHRWMLKFCQWPSRSPRWWPGKVPTPLRGCWLTRFGGSLLVVGVAHPVGLAGGDDDCGVVQQAVEDAGGGGVFGQETSPLLKGPV
jgi:hypothetical protein